MKVVTVLGARPQFVKAAVLSRAISQTRGGAEDNGNLEEVIVHTGQHYDHKMSDVFFEELEIPSPRYNLEIGSGSHGRQTGRMLECIESVLEQERPDYVLVYGDTNSTLAGGLAAAKLQIPVAHVEAGLRSYNRTMPEEINRVLVDHVSSLLFCPTTQAVKNLNLEGITTGVHFVGDVMYDSLLFHLKRSDGEGELSARWGVESGKYGLATIHRADVTTKAEKVIRLLSALDLLGFPILLPLHPRTRSVLDSGGTLPPLQQVRLIDPVSYHDMLVLEQHARLILTDSGGVQKEAFLLGVPCVTLREETEWIETVEAGWNQLAGLDPVRIVAAAEKACRKRSPKPEGLYGDGHAARHILQILREQCSGLPIVPSKAV